MVMMKNQLIKAFQRGEEWAFRKVYEQFFSPLCIYAVKYVRDASEAQDIVQDVFAALWLQHDNFIYPSATGRSTCLKRTR